MNAIILKDVSKMYRIYEKPQHKLKEVFLKGILKSRKAYHHEFWALQDVNFEIKQGEALGIIGQNGSGKSTLLQIISGVLQPTKGRVELSGRVSALLELGIGFNMEFTGKENIFMNGSILGIKREEMEKRLDQLAEFADIGEFIDQPAKTYSSGMYARLAFATAVHVDPDILIIDEALAVGDAMFVNRCFRRMEEFKKEGKTIILVSHDVQTIRSFCSTALLLDRGKVIHMGDPNKVINEYSKLIADREDEYFNKVKSREIAEQIKEKVADKCNSGFRYGSGDAEIVEIKIVDEQGIPTTVLNKGKTYRIWSTARFHKDVEEPIMGMMIKTLKGFDISGTTTFQNKLSIGKVTKGTLVTIEFKQEIYLNPDMYSLSVGVSENTDTHIRALDRRSDVIAFKVIGDSQGYGVVDIRPHISVIEKVLPAKEDMEHIIIDEEVEKEVKS